MKNFAEEKVSKFYNTIGWEVIDGHTDDAWKHEDLRAHTEKYARNTRRRVLRHIPEKGVNILDMASGPLESKEYENYSKNFEKRYCVDLSSKALEMAEKKIGSHGVFLHGSFFDIPLQEDFFDCSLSIHTIYHMDKDMQETAVRKLVSVTKPGKPVIIVYSNPSVLFLTPAQRLYAKIKSIVKKTDKQVPDDRGILPSGLYFHAYPIEWWNRFKDVADVKIFPWRSFQAHIHRKLFPDNKIGSMMFDVLYHLEERFPKFFSKHFQYPMIVLTKKNR
jgi:ubiquinone/menaquinone biosynthesis C-methylase UbiE